jgi:hypothetical protein
MVLSSMEEAPGSPSSSPGARGESHPQTTCPGATAAGGQAGRTTVDLVLPPFAAKQLLLLYRFPPARLREIRVVLQVGRPVQPLGLRNACMACRGPAEDVVARPEDRGRGPATGRYQHALAAAGQPRTLWQPVHRSLRRSEGPAPRLAF